MNKTDEEGICCIRFAKSIDPGQLAQYVHVIWVRTFCLCTFFCNVQRVNSLIIKTFQNKSWYLRVCSTSLENTVRKGEIARNKQFLLFPQCFLPVCRIFFPFLSNLKVSSAISVSFAQSKFVVWERVKYAFRQH